MKRSITFAGILKTGFIVICLCILSVVLSKPAQAKTYTITPKTKPCDNAIKFHNYNKNTKQYYMIRSYLMKIEKQKGGTLVIKKGTYNITNTLYVPSNTNIILKKGAVLKKSQKSGPEVPASTSLLQFISSKNSTVYEVYGGHEGDHDISITGSGVIDLNYINTAPKAAIGIIMGHNQNIKIEGITFKNMCFGHLIEMDACKHVSIKNCTFTGFKPSGKFNKEAINLDTPDKDREGFNSMWSKKDKTPNEDVTIENCIFDTLETGLGTHRYTGDVYHTDVKILNNTFRNCQTAIRLMNYKDTVITGNTFIDCNPNERFNYVMFFAGLRGINFSYNTFTGCGRVLEGQTGGVGGVPQNYLMQFWWTFGYNANQDLYDAITSELTEEEAALFLTNTATNCGWMVVQAGRPLPYRVDFTEWYGIMGP